MKGLSTLMDEFLAVIKNRKLFISVIGVLFVPLLYSSMLLWAFWDPYGHVDKLPVAVVNEDKGAIMDGEKLNIGDELINNLKEEKKFDWKFVSKKEAQEGLTNQKYYMMIEIPKDFSENATTLQDEHPKKSDLIYTANEGSNFLSTKIGDSAIERIKEKVSNNITETYAETVFADIKDVSKGLADASEGAGKLHDGIDSAKSGASELHGGIEKAKNGVNELHDGIHSAKNGVNEIHGGIDNAKKGASELHSGITKAKEGLNELHGGIIKEKEGLDELHNKISSAKDGAETIASVLDQSLAGMNEINSKLPQLTNGSEKVKEGATQLSDSVTQWSQGAQNVKDGAAQVSAGLNEMIQKVDGMIAQTSDPQQKAVFQSMKDNLMKLAVGNQQVEGGLNELSSSATKMKQGAESLAAGANQLHRGQLALGDGMKHLTQGQEQLANGSKQLSSGLGKLEAGAGELANGMNKISEGSGELTNGINKISEGSGKLTNGMNKLSDGSSELASGMNKLSGGSGELANGMNKLSDGSNELADGMNELSDGAGKLASKLSDGAKETSDVKANDDVYNMFADPIEVKDTKINKVPNYGTGVAPYFVSLSLFVGALVISIVFPFYEPANVPKNGFSWFIGKFGLLAVVGVIQALLVDGILLGGLGMEVQSVPLFLLFSIFTSLTFMALIQMLVTPLGNPGRFIAIIILILQLSTSAGTFPLELIPTALQPFHNWLPMSYSVAGFKAVISSGDFVFMWKNAAVLAIFFIITIAGTITYFTIQHKRQFTVMAEEKSLNA
jgi:putative membrane protein